MNGLILYRIGDMTEKKGIHVRSILRDETFDSYFVDRVFVLFLTMNGVMSDFFLHQKVLR